MRSQNTGVLVLEKRDIKQIGQKGTCYRIVYIEYMSDKMKCRARRTIVNRETLLRMLKSNNIEGINVKLSSDDKVIETRLHDRYLQVANAVRKLMEKVYGTGTDLCGQCIEATELIAATLKYFGLHNVRVVEGWCEYDDEYYGSDRPYDPHTWYEDDYVYIDVTADQFNPGMYRENEYPPIIIRKGLPHGMTYDEPEGYED